MLSRERGYLKLRTAPASDAAASLERDGYAVVRGVLSASERAVLIDEVEAVYARLPADGRNPHRPPEEDEDFRYEMLNRSPACQALVSHPRILEAIEPLLGEDCHVIANTCWRNPPRPQHSHGGGFWHIDAGPHIPRDPGIPWDERIPYPVFAIGTHVYLKDCPLESGPTGVIPGSHKSGAFPPREHVADMKLTWNGRGVVPLIAKAGDVAMFVSDVWHRRLPTLPGDAGRLFVQVHYGRRDLAQRIRPTSTVNHLDSATIERAETPRARTVIGLHGNFFYDG